MGIVVAPCLATYTTGCKVVHALLDSLITKVVVRAKGVDLIRSYLAEIFNEFGHFINAAPKFVAKGEHAEGWMMAVGAQDVLTFLV